MNFDEWVKEKAGKYNLPPYGIQCEKNDFRIHVCSIVRRIYIYPTSPIVEKIKNTDISILESILSRAVINGGDYSAIGLKWPWKNIPEIIEYQIPNNGLWEYVQNAKNNTGDKGKRAARIFHAATLCKWLPFSDVEEVTNINDQFLGIDFRGHYSTIQVKLDMKGGAMELGGTGNLFLQIAERNNLGEY